MKKVDADILIVGGGLNGATLALACAQIGLDVTVIDALPAATRVASGFDGRAYALAITSIRMLDALGIWPDLRDSSQPIFEVKASDGREGEGAQGFLLHLNHAEITDGPLGYMVEDRLLRPALLAALEDNPRITHLAGEQVVAQREGTVTLASGTTLNAHLLIGADGRGSGTAERAGIKYVGWSYDQIALVCAVSHEKPHHGVAHQFFMPDGPLAILPLPGNRSSIVWSVKEPRGTALASLDDEAFLAALKPAFGDFLCETELAGDRFAYPLSLNLAERFIANRVALIGDAAHGVHPIAGQGLNQGLRDVAALTEVLSDAKRLGEDLGSHLVLERYQQWRGADALSLSLATDMFNRLYSNDNPALRAIRSIGMGVFNALPPARRFVMREAAGLAGDVPKLLLGQRP